MSHVGIDIVERLRFDAIRCEAQFSKGVAGNLNEAADEIERLRTAAKLALAEMCITVAPRNSFTDAVDALDAVLFPKREAGK